MLIPNCLALPYVPCYVKPRRRACHVLAIPTALGLGPRVYTRTDHTSISRHERRNRTTIGWHLDAPRGPGRRKLETERNPTPRQHHPHPHALAFGFSFFPPESVTSLRSWSGAHPIATRTPPRVSPPRDFRSIIQRTSHRTGTALRFVRAAAPSRIGAPMRRNRNRCCVGLLCKCCSPEGNI